MWSNLSMRTRTIAGLCIGAFTISLFLVYGGFLLRINHVRSLLFADIIELDALFSRWREAGKPHGQALNAFMEGRNPPFLVWTNNIQLEGVESQGAFAKTNCKASPIGLAVITIDGRFLWIDSKGRVTQVLRSELKKRVTFSRESVSFVEKVAP